jgi:hypothetical protein
MTTFPPRHGRPGCRLRQPPPPSTAITGHVQRRSSETPRKLRHHRRHRRACPATFKRDSKKTQAPPARHHRRAPPAGKPFGAQERVALLRCGDVDRFVFARHALPAMTMILALFQATAQPSSRPIDSTSDAASIVPVSGVAFAIRVGTNSNRLPPMPCYCVYALATKSLSHPVLRWTGPPPTLRPDQVLLAISLADYSCAFPSTSRRPTIAGASRHGDNVKVSAALARYSNEISAALVPAPAPGGQLELTIPGSVLSLKDKHPDRCIVPVEDGLKSTRRD